MFALLLMLLASAVNSPSDKVEVLGAPTGVTMSAPNRRLTVAWREMPGAASYKIAVRLKNELVPKWREYMTPSSPYTIASMWAMSGMQYEVHMLFDSPLLFGGSARDLGIACSSCHNRGDVNRTFYIPGLSRRPGGVDVDGGFFNPAANDHRFDPLDIPSLRGVRFTAPYGRDGRTASLREFVRGVVVHEFAGAEPTPLMLDALVAYMNEFDFLPAPLLYRDGRLNARAGTAARRGEAIFNRPFPSMGGRSCAACHIPDAHFLDGRRHDIGSAAPSSTHARDSAFDTPTLLGILYTAPYFHDGVLPTLAHVVDWFNRRYALGLDAASAADLTAYLEAVGAGERPFESFDAENTRARLGFAEASVFLSTLDRLIPARDRRHALLALRSVGADLAADAAGMATPDARTAAAALASRISALARAVDDGDWREAARLWAEYREAEARHADRIH